MGNIEEYSDNKLNRIYFEIRKVEMANVKSQKWDDKKMTDAIVKYIEKIVDKEAERGEI